jgi:hypothetical protein
MFLAISIALCSYSEATVDTLNYQTHPPKDMALSAVHFAAPFCRTVAVHRTMRLYCRQLGAEPSFIMPLLGVMASLFRSSKERKRVERKEINIK